VTWQSRVDSLEVKSLPKKSIGSGLHSHHISAPMAKAAADDLAGSNLAPIVPDVNAPEMDHLPKRTLPRGPPRPPEGAFDFMMRRMSVALSRARGSTCTLVRRLVGSFVVYYPSQRS